MKKKFLIKPFVFMMASFNNMPSPKGNNKDALPSWNDTKLKKEIIAYVKKVTDQDSPNFIPMENRIATFDNDGTLWSEKPYVLELFAFYRIRQMVSRAPSLASKQPFKAVIEKDKAYFEQGGDKALIELIWLPM